MPIDGCALPPASAARSETWVLKSSRAFLAALVCLWFANVRQKGTKTISLVLSSADCFDHLILIAQSKYLIIAVKVMQPESAHSN